MEIGQQFRAARLKQRLTQRQVSDKAAISGGLWKICRIERGGDTRWSVVLAIAKALSIRHLYIGGKSDIIGTIDEHMAALTTSREKIGPREALWRLRQDLAGGG